ncbi:MAG: type II secretion system protein [Eubacteriales bacterium]|nr:type II secretion system protein [Eubacteriales bacterium]
MKRPGRRIRHRVLDDRGVTMLELVVAVAIFSIAAMVLFRSFVTSGRINRKSRIYLEATVTAQNMMEEIKSRSFPELCAAFNYPRGNPFSSLPGGSFREVQRVTEGGRTVYQRVTQYNAGFGDSTSRVTASVISKDGGLTYTFHPREKGENASRYFFEAKGVQADTQTFDVLAEFDGSAASGYKKVSSWDEDEKNDYQMPSIERLGTQNNAFLIVEKDNFDEAIKTMVEGQHDWAKGRSGGADASQLPLQEVSENTRRIIQIRVEEKEGIVTASARNVLCARSYSKAGGGPLDTMGECPCEGVRIDDWDQPYDESRGKCFCTVVGDWSIFYSSTPEQALEGVYLFYYPNYNSTDVSAPLDEIVFSNEKNLPLRFYVTKQKEEGEIADKERAYRMKLVVKERPDSGNWNTNTSLYRSATELRTNLDWNISEDSSAGRERVSQMILSYKDEGRARAVGTNQAKNILNVNGIDNKSASDRIYEAVVRVYRAGASDKNYPEDMLIASLEGAKEH